MLRPLLVSMAILVVTACGNSATPPVEREPTAGTIVSTHASERGPMRVTEITVGLDSPWGLAFLPDGGMLVTERPGRLRRVDAQGHPSKPLTGIPTVFAVGQSGLLDIALSSDFANDHLVYFSYMEANWRGNVAGTTVARGRLEGDGLVDVQVIYRQEPKLSAGTHPGSRLVFADDGTLFVTQGENNQRGTAQELDKLQGKLVRINPDGSIPADNPFVGRDGVRPEIFSYGHRNMQGAALHPVTRKLWTHEHGPKGGDEINIPEPGRNYGWPIITYGENYTGGPIPESTGTQAPGMEQPHHYWPVSPAISGMAFYTADRFPAWKGNLFIGALAARELIRLELDGDTITHEERLLGDRGERIRDVRQGPDGALYLLVDDAINGKILRIELLPPT